MELGKNIKSSHNPVLMSISSTIGVSDNIFVRLYYDVWVNMNLNLRGFLNRTI